MTDHDDGRQRGDGPRAPAPGLPARELALRSGAVLDLPPRTARVVLAVGLAALVLIVVQSLVGRRPETIAVDKLLHFAGYATLGALFVLALRPRYALLALLALAGVSYAIELLQPLNMRSLDVGDALANTLGLAVGAAVGLAARLLYGYLRTELATSRIRQALVSFPAGATIVRAGEPIDCFWVIRAGQVALLAEGGGAAQELDRLGPGEMFGLLAEIERTPQPLTVVARTAVQVYQIDYDQLIDAVGGPQQPLGVIVRYLAAELRQAAGRVAELQRERSAS